MGTWQPAQFSANSARPWAGERLVDGAEQLLGPGRRFEALQGFFDQVEVAHAYAGRITCIALKGLARAIEKRQGRPHAEGFADIACHRLLGRAVPLHPVEGPDVPQLRVVHRCVGDAIIFRGNGIAKAGVGDAAKRIGTPWAFFGGVKATVGVVPGDLEELVQRLLEVLAQLAVLGLVAIAQHLAGEALKFPWVVIGRGQAGDQSLAEAAAAQGGHAGWQHMLRRSAVDPQSLALEVQFAGVAGGAGDIQVLNVAASVFMAGKPYGQVAGVLCGGHLLGIHQEAEARQVLRRGKASLGER